jgi:hypothetical protein
MKLVISTCLKKEKNWGLKKFNTKKPAIEAGFFITINLSYIKYLQNLRL